MVRRHRLLVDLGGLEVGLLLERGHLRGDELLERQPPGALDLLVERGPEAVEVGGDAVGVCR